MRKALLAATAVVLVSSLSGSLLSEEHAASSVAPSEALDRLKKGNADFLAAKPRGQNLLSQVKATAGGQSPWVAVLSCMDSRVPPELVFQQGIGDLFSVRVAGNVVDVDDLGSLEYAAKAVGVRLLVVMGHTECGAVKGAIDDVKLGNLTELLLKIRQAVVAAGAPGSSKDSAYVDKVAEANVRISMKEIREKSPVIKELLDSGKAGLVGAMYDVKSGKVTYLAD
jgi:carbonic anhydrase